MEVPLHAFLTLALGGNETPRPLYARTHWIGGWVGPGTGLEAVGKRKNPIIATAGN